MTEHIWQLHDVTLESAGVTRLKVSDLSIHRGVTAVIGYSGAGKTSLLNVLAELERPAQGTITRSFPVPEKPADKANQTQLPLYWVPQDGGLWPHWPVRRHITAVRPQTKTSENDSKTVDFTDNLLIQFNLLHRQHAFPGDLSMGERSRLSVARSLAAKPKVLVMDEPLAHVDPVKRPEYWNVIREHLKQNETSLVFSTHEPETAISESEWVICLNNGCVLHHGSTIELYRDPPSEEAAQFLGPINWFTPQEASCWLEGEYSSSTALRAEAVRLITDENAKAEIRSIRFSGSYAETVVEHIPSSSQRTIVHRPAAQVYHVGQNVRIEVIS